jgi:N-acetylglutamate synthase
MPSAPGRVGSRVSLRYQIPGGLTDVVGHLEALDPVVVVRTKSGERVEISPADVVSVRELSHAPVRNSQIRDLERAAALAHPAAEQQWLAGWLLRADPADAGLRANSAAPLELSATLDTLPDIIDWYTRRGRQPWLDLPERLLPVRATGVQPSRMLFMPDDSGRYVRVLESDPAAIAEYESMGYRLHHRARYVLASDLL